jgi:hypothetical protein
MLLRPMRTFVSVTAIRPSRIDEAAAELQGRVSDLRQKIIFRTPSNIQSRAAHHPRTHGLDASGSDAPVGRRGEIRRRRRSDSAKRCSRRVGIAYPRPQPGGTSGYLTGLFNGSASPPRYAPRRCGDEAVDKVAAGSPHHPQPAAFITLLTAPGQRTSGFHAVSSPAGQGG